MIKKLAILSAFLFLLVTASSNSVQAQNPCNVTLGEIPFNVGTQVTSIPLTFSGMDNDNNDYELIIGYYEPKAGRTGHVNGPLADKGEWKEKSLGMITAPTFTLDKFAHREAFFMDGNLTSSQRIIYIRKITPGLPDYTCELKSYDARSSAVLPGTTACGYPGSVGSRGSEGGCVDNQMCSTSPGKGWYCECDAQCQALTPGGNPPPASGKDPTPSGEVLNCGGTTQNPNASCRCLGGGSRLKKLPSDAAGYCCGWSHVDACYGTVERYNQALAISTGDTTIPVPPQGPVSPDPAQPGSGGSPTTPDTTENTAGLNIFDGPKSADFKELNPLRGNASLSSPGGILSRVLMFSFPLAGLILFTMLVWGGFEMLVGATGKGIDAGKQRVTNAIIGFFALFVSYWVFQIVEVIFGLQIL